MTLQEQLNDAQQNLCKIAAEQNSPGLLDFWEGLNPATRRALRNTAIGSLLGGALGAGAGVISPDKGMASSGLMGATLGGLAGGGATLGYDLLRSNLNLPGEESKPGALVDRAVVDPTVGTIISNPATAAGAAAGGIWAGTRFPTLGKYMHAAEKADAASRVTRQPTVAKAAVARLIYRIRKNKLLSKKGLKARAALHELASGRHKALYGRGNLKTPWHLAAVPVGIGAGMLVDRYLKGKNA